jgi:mRNA-degrading endonuclease RelE of RelBE toxin-antitoxin system
VSSGYRWVAHQQAVEFLLRLPSANRRFLIEQLDKLADDPNQETDSILKEPGGRTLQLKIAGHFIITYWPDHAVKEVRIVAIESA